MYLVLHALYRNVLVQLHSDQADVKWNRVDQPQDKYLMQRYHVTTQRWSLSEQRWLLVMDRLSHRLEHTQLESM